MENRQPSDPSHSNPNHNPVEDNHERSIKLQSSDGEVFEVSRAVAFQMMVVKALVVDLEKGILQSEEPRILPLPMVTSAALTLVIEYCEHHAKDASKENAGDGQELKEWDSEFVSRVFGPNRNAIDLRAKLLLNASHYLNVKLLQDLLTQEVANVLTGRSVEEMRTILGVENDFTPEEEEEIRQQNSWAFSF